MSKQLLAEYGKCYSIVHRTANEKFNTTMGTLEACKKRLEEIPNELLNLPESKHYASSYVRIRYGNKLCNIEELSSVFDCSVVYIAAFYYVHGADIKGILRELGRDYIEHHGHYYDRLELGNRMNVPWDLMQDIDDPELVYKLHDHYLRGLFVDKNISHGKPNKEPSDKVKKDFDVILTKLLQSFSSLPKLQPHHVDKARCSSAAQARTVRRRAKPADIFDNVDRG